MRDWLEGLITRLREADRQQQLYLILGVVALIVVLRYGVSWFGEHREAVREDSQQHAQRLANARQLLERAPAAATEAKRLRQRYAEVTARLLSGDSPALAAAALQDRLSSVATERGVAIQSTQVLREDAQGDFQQAALRVTATGELGQLAHFLAELEQGTPQIEVTFIELNRRASPVRRVGVPTGERARNVSATLQVTGFLQESARMEGDAAAAEEEQDEVTNPPRGPAAGKPSGDEARSAGRLVKPAGIAAGRPDLPAKPGWLAAPPLVGKEGRGANPAVPPRPPGLAPGRPSSGGLPLAPGLRPPPLGAPPVGESVAGAGVERGPPPGIPADALGAPPRPEGAMP